MLMQLTPYPHFVPLHKEKFESIAYPLLGGVTRSQMGDVFAYISHSAEDLTANDHLILFGVPIGDMEVEADTDLSFVAANKPSVWDMNDLEFDTLANPNDCVWRSPYARLAEKTDKPLEFIMQLAGGDPGLYDDIMQSLAPLVMARKPDGVIWWVGDGANGKSTLMDAVYKIFPGQLSSITVKRLTDGRDTPSLNGTLANVVKESSEGRIDDTEIYKSIGTHEDFRVHKFHSQDDILIRGNLHHIFSGNSIPAFNDKGFSARRRTFIVPFTKRFESDPTFEERTFTPEMFGRLIAEMCRFAQRIKAQGYRYNWSAATLEAKLEYDSEANSAEEYARDLIKQGIVAFDSFNPLRTDYENWCADEGYVPLGVGNLRRAIQALGFERATSTISGETFKRYILVNSVDRKTLQPMGMGRPGFYTAPGFVPDQEPEPVPDVPEFTEPVAEPEPPKKKILMDKW